MSFNFKLKQYSREHCNVSRGKQIQLYEHVPFSPTQTKNHRAGCHSSLSLIPALQHTSDNGNSKTDSYILPRECHIVTGV